MTPSQAVAAGVALLATRGAATALVGDRAYLPANAVVAAALLTLGRAAGCSWADLGLGPSDAHRGLRVGGAAAAPAAAALALAAAVPATRRLFDDERVRVDAGRRELARQVALRIPVGTVAFEEVAFRGVLLALLRRWLGDGPAVGADSALFGLWHVVPTMRAAGANHVSAPASHALVGAAVVTTTAAGGVFCWLRRRGRHLLAPAALHLAVNDVGYLLAWRLRVREQAPTRARPQPGARP